VRTRGTQFGRRHELHDLAGAGAVAVWRGREHGRFWQRWVNERDKRLVHLGGEASVYLFELR
jgi:hypothetical protein